MIKKITILLSLTILSTTLFSQEISKDSLDTFLKEISNLNHQQFFKGNIIQYSKEHKYLVDSKLGASLKLDLPSFGLHQDDKFFSDLDISKYHKVKKNKFVNKIKYCFKNNIFYKLEFACKKNQAIDNIIESYKNDPILVCYYKNTDNKLVIYSRNHLLPKETYDDFEQVGYVYPEGINSSFVWGTNSLYRYDRKNNSREIILEVHYIGKDWIQMNELIFLFDNGVRVRIPVKPHHKVIENMFGVYVKETELLHLISDYPELLYNIIKSKSFKIKLSGSEGAEVCSFRDEDRSQLTEAISYYRNQYGLEKK